MGEGDIRRGFTKVDQTMESHDACIDPASAVEKRSAAHKSRTHRLLDPHKQTEGWDVLALSNGRWKLPDDQFGAFLEHYVADVPRFNLGLVVKKSEYFPYIMDVDKSTTKGASVGSPMEVLRVISFPGGEAALCAAPPWAALSEAQEGAPEPCELSRAVPGDHSGQSHRRSYPREAVSRADLGAPRGRLGRHRGREGADLERPAPAGVSEVQRDLWADGREQKVQGGGGRRCQRLLRAVPDRFQGWLCA